MIDTHCHLFASEFDEDRINCIQKAKSVGVEKILMPNIDTTSISNLYNTESQYPDVCYAMMGLHPCSVNQNYISDLKIIEEHLNKRNFVGIGEIGIDLYWDKTYIIEQKEVFKRQIEWALEKNYAVSIHCREAFKEIFEVLDTFEKTPRGVFHCFTGNKFEAQKILSYGTFKFGIGGVITFTKSTLPDVIKDIDLSQIVLETDAPYLAPVPYRGKRNEPSYLVAIADKVSKIKNISLEDVQKITTVNATSVFGI